MSKIKITAVISIENDGDKEYISKLFSKKEVSNVIAKNGFVSFNILNTLAIPLVISSFSSPQLYVNGNAVNMKMLK